MPRPTPPTKVACRLTNLSGGGVSSTSYGFNGVGARKSKSNSSGTRTYKRDGVGVTAPVLSDGVSTMVPGISEKTSGTTNFIHADRIGSTKSISSAATVSFTADYDAFGKVLSTSGSTTTQKGFAGEYGYKEDSESGYKLLGHRLYDSESGRFLSRDPIQHGRNWYTYCESKPTKFVDPRGLFPEIPGIIIRVFRFIGRYSRQEGGYLLRKQGVEAAKNGNNIVVIGKRAQRVAREMAEEAYGKENVLHHAADDHAQPVGTPLDHYQDGSGARRGHIFYRLKGVIAFFLGDNAANGNLEGAINDNLNPAKSARDIEEAVEAPITDMVEKAKRGRENSLRYWLDEGDDQ